jgi:hypothetical protein
MWDIFEMFRTKPVVSGEALLAYPQLKKLTRRYPVKDILGSFYGRFKADADDRDITCSCFFRGSPAQNAETEWTMLAITRASAREDKWVGYDSRLNLPQYEALERNAKILASAGDMDPGYEQAKCELKAAEFGNTGYALGLSKALSEGFLSLEPVEGKIFAIPQEKLIPLIRSEVRRLEESERPKASTA